jgi:alkylation response protein AidB-like acyl-CoA dehydrogenase
LSRPDYIARAAALAPRLSEAAAPAEAGRRLDEGVVAALHETGLFRMLAPIGFGGGEARPSVFAETIETLARADASPAWCLCQMAVCNLSVAYLSPAAARDVFASPTDAIAWGSTRDAKAVAVDGGYRVSGSWEFGSGLHHASWLGGHCPVVNPDGSVKLGENGRPLDRTVLFPRASATLADTWKVLGLRATGSDAYALQDLFVPEDHAILGLGHWPDAEHAGWAAPYRFNPSALYAAGFAALALGNARAMLDAFIALATNKTPIWQRNPISQGQIVQVGVAEAHGRIESARAWLFEALRAAEDEAMAEGAPAPEHRMAIRGAATFAIKTTSRVAQDLFALAGSTAIFDGDPLERRFRDAQVIGQHLQARTQHLEAVGKHLLGLETDLRFA